MWRWRWSDEISSSADGSVFFGHVDVFQGLCRQWKHMHWSRVLVLGMFVTDHARYYTCTGAGVCEYGEDGVWLCALVLDTTGGGAVAKDVVWVWVGRFLWESCSKWSSLWSLTEVATGVGSPTHRPPCPSDIHSSSGRDVSCSEPNTIWPACQN